MGYTNLYQRKPPGASCGWVQQEIAAGAPYRWWRPSSGQGCSVRKAKFMVDGGAHTLILTTTIGSSNNPGMSWNGGSPSSCGTLGTYFSTDNTGGYVGLLFDVWKALQDGAWTSSLALTLTRWNASATTLRVGAFDASGGTASGPPVATLAVAVAGSGAWSACTVTGAVTNTVTFYNDGRVTLV